jgi:hypothetical protein
VRQLGAGSVVMVWWMLEWIEHGEVELDRGPEACGLAFGPTSQHSLAIAMKSRIVYLAVSRSN